MLLRSLRKIARPRGAKTFQKRVEGLGAGYPVRLQLTEGLERADPGIRERAQSLPFPSSPVRLSLSPLPSLPSHPLRSRAL